jgi:ech hydrogenase subunit A
MAVIVLAVIVCFAAFFGRKSKKRTVPIYLAGVGLDFENRTYRNSLSGTSRATQRNWYMESWFGEGLLTPIANVMCIVILVFGAVASLVNFGGWPL